MRLKYDHDQQADAIYIHLPRSESYACGKDLDDERRIDYAADDTPIGVELLCVSNGVSVSGLPNSEEIIKLYSIETASEATTIVFTNLTVEQTSAIFPQILTTGPSSILASLEIPKGG